MKNYKHIGKLMSLALRHNPQVLNLKLDANGWVSVEALLKGLNAKGKNMNREKLTELVETNDKKRYAFSKDGLKIRANQGHSINVDVELKITEPPYTLYHGTVDKFMSAIFREDSKENGLQKMSRQHVHLSQTKDTAINVGSRRGKPVILKVKAKEMYEKGYVFYLSENGVWLTNHVPAEFLIKV